MSKVIFREKSRAQERRESRNQKKLQQKKKSRNYHERIQKRLDQRDIKKYSIEDLDEFADLQKIKTDVWELENEVHDELKEVQDLLHELNPHLNDLESTGLSNFRHYIDRARWSKHWKSIEWDGWNLPAQSKEYEICDKWVDFGCNNIAYHPENQHYSEHQQYKCKRSSCVLCVESWINRQAARTTRRLSKYCTMQPYKFRHIILSPPPNMVNGVNYDYDKLKKYLDFALKVAKIKTASIVFHPFRFYDSKKTKPYYSPHFHILTTDFVTNTTEFYNKTKWVIDNKGELETEIDIFNCIRYQLSHAGTKAHHHAVRYTGDVSYRKLKIEKEPKINVCPYCQLELLLFRVNPEYRGEPPPINHVGLFDPDAYVLMDNMDDHTDTVCYQLNREPKSVRDYSEYETFNFEMSLLQKTRFPYITNLIKRMSSKWYQKSKMCSTLERWF